MKIDRHPLRRLKSTPVDLSSQSLEELLIEFEALGTNCDFGLVQRICGAEPLGLFRFAGSKIANLTSVLENSLDGFLTPDDLALEVRGQEYTTFSKAYADFHTHTHAYVGRDDETVVLARERRKAGYLKRRFLEDWAEGTRVYVHCGSDDEAAVRRLHDVLNARSRRVLLWVIPAERREDRGRVETLAPTLLKGYIAYYGTYANDPRLDLAGWAAVCRSARAMLRGTATPRPEQARLRSTFRWRRDVGGSVEIAGGVVRCRVDRDPGFHVPVARVTVESSFVAIERAVFSVWVRWPKAGVARDMVLVTRDARSINARRPDWSKDGEWQQIWIVMHLQHPGKRVEIAVHAQAEVGSTFFLAGWQIEAGVIADESLPSVEHLSGPRPLQFHHPDRHDIRRRVRSAVATTLMGVASRLTPADSISSPADASGDRLARTLLEKADALMHARLLDDAETVLDAAATLYPRNAEIFTHRAVSAEFKDDFREAVRRWQHVVRAFPSIALGHYRLAAALRIVGDMAAAQRVIDDAMGDHAGDAAMLAEAARVSGAAGRWAEAVARWDAALASAGKQPAWVDERTEARHALALGEATDRSPDQLGRR